MPPADSRFSSLRCEFQHRRRSILDFKFRSRIGIKLGLSVLFSLGFALALGFASTSVAGDQDLSSRSAYGIRYTTTRSRVSDLGFGLIFWALAFWASAKYLGRWLYNLGRWLELWTLAFNTWAMAGKPLERRLPRGKYSDSQRLLTADPPSSLFPSFSPFFSSYLYPFGSFSSSSSSPDSIPVQTTTGNTFARGTACMQVYQSSNGLHRVFLSSGWIGRGRR